MKNKIKCQKGVTLVVLIITIIVMLILAGVCINVATNGKLFEKAEDANNLNQGKINQAKDAEDEALKQNYKEYVVDENVERDYIEAYAIKIEDGKDTLVKIEDNIALYVEKNNIDTLYFKVSNTNRNNLFYNLPYGGEMKNEYLDEQTGEVLIYAQDIKNENSFSTNNKTFKKKGSIVEVDVANLNGLLIEAKKDSESAILARLELHYNEKEGTEIGDSTIYLPRGSVPNLIYKEAWKDADNKEHDAGYYLEGIDTKILMPNGTVGDYLSTKKVVNLSTKTITNPKTGGTETISAELSKDNTTSIEGARVEVLPSNKGAKIEVGRMESDINTASSKLYIVQEIVNSEKNMYDKTIYMDDFDCKAYIPIEKLEMGGPKTLPYIVPKEAAEEVIFDYGNSEPADIWSDSASIESIEPAGMEGKFVIEKIDEKYKIYSTITEITGENSHRIKVKISATDYGGKKVESFGLINLATNNFILLVDGREVGCFSLFEEVFNGKDLGNGNRQLGAKDYLSVANPKPVTILQNVAECDIPESLLTPEEIKNVTNNEVKKYAYFDIGNNLGTKNYDLTYDLQGNNLNLALKFKDDEPHNRREVKLRIGEGKTFTLKSTGDANTSMSGVQNGQVIFDYTSTFENNAVFKHIDLKDFVSVPKYAKFESLQSYIIAEKGDDPWYYYIYMGVPYVNDFLIAFKEYLNSFNSGGLQNKDYTREVEAVINNGTFNFYSGCLVLTSTEQVRAFGAWDGSVVLDIAEGFLQTLNNVFGLEIASITDYSSGYASLQHTGTVIANNSNLVLGDGQVKGISDDSRPYPEIIVNLESKEEAIGVTMGSIFNPNRAFTRAYGVWNKNASATTTMNSGFISMIIRNDTNNWVSLGVGRAYGIFNDHGTTYFNGYTKKKIDIAINYYGLTTLSKQVVDFKSDKLKGLEDKINALLNELNNLVEYVRRHDYDGFYTLSTQKILYNFTGGATIVYTNSYAIANAPGRPVNKGDSGNDADDGIIFSQGPLALKEVNFEADFSSFTDKDQANTMKTLIPIKFYYRVYDEVKDPNDKEGVDYNTLTHQKIINPLNTLFEGKLGVVDGLATGFLGSIVNGLNNIAFSSWIGQDFVDNDDVFASLIQVGFRSIEQSFTKLFNK